MGSNEYPLAFGVRASSGYGIVGQEAVEWLSDCNRIIDLGCSNGGLLQMLRAANPSADLTGVDIGAERIELAKKACPSCTFLTQDVQKGLPFPDSSFDGVVSVEVIEHLDAPGHFLKEIHRILAPAGKLFLTTPNADALMRRIRPDRWYALSDPTHLLFFTPYSLTHLLRSRGFFVQKIRTGSGLKNRLVERMYEISGLGGQMRLWATKSTS